MTDICYDLVPTDLLENLEFRLDMREKAAKDKGFRDAVATACKYDVLFFLTSTCWLVEPRPRKVKGVFIPKVIPFIPWPHQIEPILAMRKYLGSRDVGLEKSRAQGATWIAMLLALHDFLFIDETKIGVVSSTELKTDDPDNAGSLFGKLDWQIKRLPRWLVGKEDKHWKRSNTNHTLSNLRNGSLIAGFSCTGEIGRGDRFTWFFGDEVASWPHGQDEDAMRSIHHATDSRLIVSTPEGNVGSYYNIMHSPSNIIKLILDWKDNPTQNKGLYRHVNSRCMALDPVNNPLPPNYESESREMFIRLSAKGFKLNGEIRSPWYDEQCDRADASPHSIARELDRDYGGATYRYFTREFFTALDLTVKEPLHRGRLVVSQDSLEGDFEHDDMGPAKLWCELDVFGEPPRHPYIVGADISSGTGGTWTSNSVVVVYDQSTREQVAEYATNTEEPGDFAETCIAFCKFFHDAHLIWEDNYGPGFKKRIRSRNYWNIFYQKQGAKGAKSRRRKEPGFWSDDKTRPDMLSFLLYSVRSGAAKVYSKEFQKEADFYHYKNGKIVCIHSANTDDPSAMGKAHGDRIVPMALCLVADRAAPVAREIDQESEDLDQQDSSPYSIMGRFQHAQPKRPTEDDWDGRSNEDIMYGDAAVRFPSMPRDDGWMDEREMSWT